MSNESILIVDDNPDNLSVLRQLLEDSGYRVRPAESGKMALTSLRYGGPVDLILLDIRMPNMDGYQVCQALKAESATDDIPVIFLSALSDPEDKVKAFECGGVDYVSKPFNDAEVLARVKTHLQVRTLQQRLQRHNEELEEQVAERTAELSASNLALRKSNDALGEANAGLEKALKARNDFLSLMNHEFRTPLNAIIGMAEILKNFPRDESIPQEYMTTIESSGWRLLRLVDDILQVAQTGAPDASKEASAPTALDVPALCQASLQTIAVPARDKQIVTELTTEERIPLLKMPVNAARLRQIIGNLLDNAVKFTPAQGRIGVNIFFQEDSRQVYIEVWDSGPGIPFEERDKVFEPFVQLEPVLSRSNEGPGLGLTLARNLAKLHGGKIEIREREGGGCIFQLNLPGEPAGTRLS